MGIPCISAIVPAYNCEDYIKRCLDSILAQTIPGLEIVAVDDGSTDRTGEFLDRYASRHPALRVVRQDNAGVAAARNAGLLHARGKYIGFVDSDDYIEPTMYACLYERAEKACCELCMCDYDLIYRNGVLSSGPALPDQTLRLTGSEAKEAFYLRYLAQRPVLWNKIYRRETIVRARLSFPLNSGEDYLFNLQLLPEVERVALVSQTFYHYVQRRNSVVHGADCRCNAVSVQVLEQYAKHPASSQRMLSLVCGQLLTGFLFSPFAQGKPVSFFLEQLHILQQSPAFFPFCRDMAEGKLAGLYQKDSMSRKFYTVLQIIARACANGHDRLAAREMQLVGRVLSKRRGTGTLEFFE